MKHHVHPTTFARFAHLLPILLILMWLVTLYFLPQEKVVHLLLIGANVMLLLNFNRKMRQPF